MATAPQREVTTSDISRFQACTDELRRTVEHLQDVEQEMADAIEEMSLAGDNRAQLFVAEGILADLRAALAELGCVRRLAQ